MQTGLEDKVVWITGASGGIGRALSEAFAAEGARLILHGNARFGALEAWVSTRPFRDRVLLVRADLADPAAIESAMKLPLDRFGRIDVTIANAGHWPKESLLAHEMPIDRIRRTVDANLFSTLWTARVFMSSLARSGPRPDGHGPSLVLIGSTAGRFGEKGHVEYSLSKAGLYGLLRTLKNEVVHLDPHARVNMIEPGWTVTHLVREELDRPGAIRGVARTMPLRQLGRAKDIAAAAVFLSSPLLSRHTSGEVLTIAGGMEGRVQWAPEEIDEESVRHRLGAE